MDSGWGTIVGVVGDIKTAGVGRTACEPETYGPAPQVPRAATSLAIHTRSDPAKLAATVVREIHAAGAGLSILQVSTIDEILARGVFGRRMQTALLAIFAAVARYRWRRWGFTECWRTPWRSGPSRLAYGWRSVRGRRMFCSRLPDREWVGSAIGILIGVGRGLALTRLLSKMLFEMSATDPMTFPVRPPSCWQWRGRPVKSRSGELRYRHAVSLSPNSGDRLWLRVMGDLHRSHVTRENRPEHRRGQRPSARDSRASGRSYPTADCPAIKKAALPVSQIARPIDPRAT